MWSAVADVAGLDPLDDNYVEVLMDRLGWHPFEAELKYALALRRELEKLEPAEADMLSDIKQLSALELRSLWWPSAEEPEATRWPDRHRDTNTGLWTVHVFGRELLATVHDLLSGTRRLFLYGLEGVGKSHILAMLALSCQAAHHRDHTKPVVCFVPSLLTCITDCYRLWLALVQAFIYDPCALAELAALKAAGSPLGVFFGDLAVFVRSHNVLLIADHYNALAAGAHVDGNKELQTSVAEFIASCHSPLSTSTVVYAASASQTAIDILGLKPNNIKKVCLHTAV